MINDFYITASDIIDPDNNDFDLYSCKLTEQILSGVTSAKTLIDNIEAFNKDKPRDKRINYTIAVEGSPSPIFVAFTKFINDEWAVVYGYNRNGTGSFMTNKGHEKLVDGISTHLISVSRIVDVNFGSFVKSDCEFILETPEAVTMTEEKALKLLTEEIAIINSNISAGEFRNAIEQFNIYMRDNKLNEFDYNYNNAAWAKYITLCGTYMNLVKNIVGRHDDPTINVNNSKFANNMYFFEDAAERDEFLKTVEHTRMNISDQNTFFEDDIAIYRTILSGNSWSEDPGEE